MVADDNNQAVAPSQNTQAYVHRSIIGSGVLSYPGGVKNSNGQLFITQLVNTNAPCDEVDANGQPDSHPVLLVKLENTGSMFHHDYGDHRCYIRSYNINTSEALITRVGDITSKNFQLVIPFSVAQGGDWHSGFDHQGSHHFCGESGWLLTGFQIEYSIYCAPGAS